MPQLVRGCKPTALSQPVTVTREANSDRWRDKLVSSAGTPRSVVAEHRDSGYDALGTSEMQVMTCRISAPENADISEIADDAVEW
ncbi:hypothetical protein ACQP2U_43810 (plasmid) [Nocardia sp. CA-084685]|uniref:hypothetical protein n=1 Tax=Nocardia sp. CA-084685 TaxID=3239970 RepID=UPI003D97A1BE